MNNIIDFLKENVKYVPYLILFIGAITLFYNIWVRNKRPCKIIYYPQKGFNIYNQLIHNFKDFDIRYKGTQITDSIIYITGKFVVKGKDINSKNNEIHIYPPDGCSWIAVLAEDNKINAQINRKNDNDALLTFDIFRRGKVLTMSALLATKDVLSSSSIEDIQFKITFEHEIVDTDDVKIKNSYHTAKMIFNDVLNNLIPRI